MPRPLVAANWKMYKTPEEAAAYLRRWASMQIGRAHV